MNLNTAYLSIAEELSKIPNEIVSSWRKELNKRLEFHGINAAYTDSEYFYWMSEKLKEYKEELSKKTDKARIDTYRKLVMPEDMNPAGRLFGGRIMQWADEAAALYVMCQLKSRHCVTLKVSDILFKEPVENGDFLVFKASTAKIGNTSITVALEVYKKDIAQESPDIKVLTCEFVFVKIDPETKKPVPHGLNKE